jgi:Domain of unknown function (DUF1611_C) P-loop domain
VTDATVRSAAAAGTPISGRPLPRGAVRSSVTRIADLSGEDVTVAPLPRERWATGDYAVGEVLEHAGGIYDLESTSGRMVEVIGGGLIVGAFGSRSATLEAVGDWREIGDDLLMETLTRAGVLGRTTSATPFARPHLVPLRYKGHVIRSGAPVRMRDCVPRAPLRPLTAPVVLVIGTSMSAGKTTTAITVIRRLRRRGLRVAGAKVTGVARYREILGLGDAGADTVVDFVDAGLPSTLCPPDEYEEALATMCSLLQAGDPDVVVIEAGASPLEPYNVDRAIAALRDNINCTILCASDPYAVVGVATAYGIRPDLVAGRATSTSAGIALCARLARVECLNLLDPDTHPELDELLGARLDL